MLRLFCTADGPAGSWEQVLADKLAARTGARNTCFAVTALPRWLIAYPKHLRPQGQRFVAKAPQRSADLH